MAKLFFLGWIFVLGAFAQNPQSITWKDLSQVQFSKKLNKQLGEVFMYPTFDKKIANLNGKEVVIKGYMIPMDPAAGLFVVSANPMASCFFCGASGLESLIELDFKKKGQRFKTDEVKSIKGIFRTNDSDVEHLIYLIEQAEVL
jgi:hypothetical protein